MIWRVT